MIVIDLHNNGKNLRDEEMSIALLTERILQCNNIHKVAIAVSNKVNHSFYIVGVIEISYRHTHALTNILWSARSISPRGSEGVIQTPVKEKHHHEQIYLLVRVSSH